MNLNILSECMLSFLTKIY